MVPRVRDTQQNREVTLRSYEQLQALGAPANDRLMKRILHGLSCSRYRECSEAIPEALSLSRSTVSMRYIRASKKKLQALMERGLDRYDFIGIVLDGKRFGDDGIIVAVGITMEGEKVLLGIIQSSTENHSVCRDFLLRLIERGLKYEQGLLCVIDGAKGFKKALNVVFGAYGIMQQDQRSPATQETEGCDAERNLKDKEKGGSGCLMCNIGAATEFQLRKGLTRAKHWWWNKGNSSCRLFG